LKCSKCQIENPEGMKFCGECGAKLEKFCPACGYSNPPQFKFCGECGQPLALPTVRAPQDLSFDEKLAKIQRYLPEGLTQKILSQRDRIEGEKKQVTVLFCDLEGFTALSEKLGPEKMYGLMDQVYEILIHEVNDYEGTVNEMTGDGIMALFGAPIALEDAPQRAIRSALAIHREMTRVGEVLRLERGIPPLRMRIGIHTGPVVVGTLGNDLRVEFKAVGDTVNLASRMEALAEPGATYVTEDTFKLTEGLFRFEGLGERVVKGKEKSIRIYRAIAPSTSRTRFDVSAERGLTPFVGRERERELLLDAMERAKQGRGQVVSIVSEAGMGKSRLLYEFRKAVLNEDITFLEGKCLSFSRGVAYQPIADILKSHFDIRDGDGDLVVRNKVREGIQAMDVEESPAMPFLLSLLSVQDSSLEKIALSPEGRKERTFETLKRIILKGAQIRPLVMAIEDLHWIDRTSEAVLKYLLESIAGSRILLILTYRPEFIPTWGARSYHNQLLLNRLSNRESLLMAQHILDTKHLETALEEVILEKTEGIPFFVEEFIKSLKDLGFIERKDETYRISKELQTIRIPSTIQDIIMARVDALPEGAKELLQVGSLIEREFGYRLIRGAIHLPEEELLRRLSILKDAELLYERGLFPDSTFVFKHALTREVVYGTLLERKKKELHLDIARAIEAVYKENLEEMYGALAEHFEEGGDYEKAAQYFRLAARKARRAPAFTEAIALSKRRVTSLERLMQTDEVKKKVIDARVTLANSCLILNHIIEAREAVAPIIDLVEHLNYRKRLPAIYITMVAYLLMVEERFDDDETHRYLREVQKRAQEEKDYLSLASSYFYEGHAYFYDCEFAKAEASFVRLMEMSEAAGYVIGLVVAKFNLATAYSQDGRIDQALLYGQEALHLALQADDPYLKGGAYGARGVAFFHKGLFLEAEENLTMAVQMSKKSEFVGGVLISFFYLGLLHFEKGRYREAQECWDDLLALYDRVRMWPSIARLAQLMKVAAGVRGRLDPAIDTALNFDLQEVRLRFLQGWAAQAMGEIYLHMDDAHIDEAGAWMRKAIETDEQNRMPWSLARAYALYAEFFKKKGALDQAKENLHKAIELMRHYQADGWVEKYERELALLQ
jgi:class 3 adenylate cyclase/tetratricopeptide (TPR) repeat protein